MRLRCGSRPSCACACCPASIDAGISAPSTASTQPTSLRMRVNGIPVVPACPSRHSACDSSTLQARAHEFLARIAFELLGARLLVAVGHPLLLSLLGR